MYLNNKVHPDHYLSKIYNYLIFFRCNFIVLTYRLQGIENNFIKSIFHLTFVNKYNT